MTKAERVLALLEALQDRAFATGPELAARLGVDVRTLRRDVAALRSLGIPVEGERGRGGSYRLRPGYRVPPLMIAIKRTGPRGSSRATRKTEGAALHRDLTPGQTVCSQLNPCLRHFVVGRQLVSRSLFHGVHGAEEGPSGF